MKQPESIDLVAEFHRTFKHPILSTPTIPDEKRCKLRVDLIGEELNELEEAIEMKDIVAHIEEKKSRIVPINIEAVEVEFLFLSDWFSKRLFLSFALM